MYLNWHHFMKAYC